MSDVFISYSHHDKTTAERAQTWLRGEGYDVFLDDTNIPGGQPWEQVLVANVKACRAVVVIHSANWQKSRWGFFEAAFARTLGKPILTVLIDNEEPDGLLHDLEAIRLIDDDEAYNRLRDGLKSAGVDPKDSFSLGPDTVPYPGLAAFAEDQAAVFFGRKKAIAEGLDPLQRVRQLGTTCFMMILGPSGCGKSSLVRAGLIPRLRREPHKWIIIDPIRPLDDPSRELSAALGRALGGAHGGRRWESIMADIRAAMDSVVEADATSQTGDTESSTTSLLECRAETNPILDIANELRRPNQEARVVITIDQFEELFDPARADKSTRFMAVLRDASEKKFSPVVVLGTMRSDFLGSFQSNKALVGLDDIQLLVDPMAAGDLRAVITGPAVRSGITVDPELVAQMLADATSNENALPLLAFTLRELYEKCGDDKRLELREYRDELGGLEGAIARTAESIVGPLRQSEVNQLRRAFLAMASLVEEGKYAKRVARAEEIDPQVLPILDKFEEARLLVRGSDTDGAPTYEVRHDAIFRAWSQLAHWLDEAHDDLRLRRDLNAAAAQWVDGNQAADRLWTDARIDRARELVDAGRLTLDTDTEEFVRTAARARERRRRRLVLGSIIVASIMAVLAGVSWIARNDAARKERAARSRAIAARAVETVDERPDLALLLGLEGLRLDDTRETRDAVLTLNRATAATAYVRGHSGFVADVSWDRASNLVASVDRAGTLSLWDATSGQQLALHRTDRQSYGVALSRSATRIAIASADGVLVWNLAVAGLSVLDDEPLLIPSNGPITAVSFDPTGQVLAAAEPDFSVHLFDATTGEPFAQPSISHRATIWNLSFSRDGLALVTASDDGEARVWDLDTGESVALAHDVPVRDAALSPDGKLVATAADDHLVRVWDLEDPRAPQLVLAGHTARVRSVAFSDDGALLASGGDDQSVIVWEGASPIARLVGHEGLVSAVSFGPESELASSGSDGTVIIWEPLHRERRTFAGHAQSVRSIAFSSDGGMLASVGEAGEAVIWNTADGSIIASYEGTLSINGLAFRPDDRVIATAGDDPVIRLWSTADLAPVGEFPGHTDRVWSVAYSPDGRHLASSGDDGTVVIVEPASGTQSTVYESERSVRAVAFGGSDLLAWGGDDGTVDIWDVAAGEMRHTLTDHIREVWAVAFSPDGRWLAGAGNDEVVLIWDVESGALVTRLTGATQALRDVAFDPGGETVSAVGQDGSILVWAVRDWRLVDRIDNQAGRLWTVSYQPTANVIASGGVDGTVALWDMDLNAAVANACRIAGRNMTLEEWGFFVGDGSYVRHCPDYPSGAGAPAAAPAAEYQALLER